MIKPIILDELFEINDGLTPEFNDGVIIIDNFYKNYDEIHDMLNNCSVPRWKCGLGSRNFIDYYDCRLKIGNDHHGKSFTTKINSLASLIKYFYNDPRNIELKFGEEYEFNIYQNIKKDIPNTLQHFPHTDTCYNVIVYLDKICSGGTCIYPTIDALHNSEEQNLLFDVINYDKFIINSKPNRMVIFEGTKYHGGYIEDHNSYMNQNWRINQVMFFDEVEH